MTGLCLIAGLLTVPLGDAITLRWTHSIEKIVWEEDYRRVGHALQLVEARVRGTGAGMEPPAGAIWRAGAWHYAPALPPLAELRLTHSPFTVAYEICRAGICRPVTAWLPDIPTEATLILRPCD